MDAGVIRVEGVIVETGVYDDHVGRMARSFRQAAAARMTFRRAPDTRTAATVVPDFGMSVDEVTASGYAGAAATPFDDVRKAVSGHLDYRNRTRPPRTRFMVRTATVGRPHRQTKRDYDYFRELNEALAGQNMTGGLESTD